MPLAVIHTVIYIYIQAFGASMAPYPFFLPLVSLPEASEGSVIQKLLFIILHDAETV